jgi:hypothetical protein
MRQGNATPYAGRAQGFAGRKGVANALRFYSASGTKRGRGKPQRVRLVVEADAHCYRRWRDNVG